MRETLREFGDRTDRETWKGTSTAFRNGARCRLLGRESKYLFRRDFQEAWLRGWEAMDLNLKQGNSIVMVSDRDLELARESNVEVESASSNQ